MDTSLYCPHCQLVLEKEIFVDAFLRGRQQPCVCGQTFDLLNQFVRAMTWAHVDFTGASLAMVGATITHKTFPLRAGQITQADLTEGDEPLPATARIVSLNLTGFGAGCPLPLLLTPSEVLVRSLGPRLAIVGYTLGGEDRSGEVQILAAWHDTLNIPLSNLMDAAIDFRHGRYDAMALSAQIAFESAITPLLVRADPNLGKDRKFRFFSAKIQELPRLETLFGVPAMPARLSQNLSGLRDLRNEKGHTGHATLDRNEAATFLTSALLGLKYSQLFESYLP